MIFASLGLAVSWETSQPNNETASQSWGNSFLMNVMILGVDRRNENQG